MVSFSCAFPRTFYLLLFFAIASSASNAYAFLTTRRVGAALLIAAIGRLHTKDYTDLSDTTFMDEVNKLRNKPFNQQWLVEFITLCDNYLIGHPFKSAGLKAVGKSFAFKGQKRLLGSCLDEDALEVVLYTKKSQAAYGLLGIAWSMIMPTIDALKKLKDFDDCSQYHGLLDTPVFDCRAPRP